MIKYGDWHEGGRPFAHVWPLQIVAISVKSTETGGKYF